MAFQNILYILNIFMKFIYFLFRIDLERERGEIQGERDLPFIDSLPKWLSWPELGLSETRSLELPLSIPHGCRDPKT